MFGSQLHGGINMNDTKALTRQQVANLLNVRCETLSRWAARNEGPPFVRIGKTIRYHAAEIDRFLRGEQAVHNYKAAVK
jgi:excisionase family DNA binding protein